MKPSASNHSSVCSLHLCFLVCGDGSMSHYKRLNTVGCQEVARTILAPFSYGAEFLRLNADALDAYAACTGPDEVQAVQEALLAAAALKASAKLQKQAQLQEVRVGSGGYGGYMDDLDLPPREDDWADNEGYFEEDEQAGQDDGSDSVLHFGSR